MPLSDQPLASVIVVSLNGERVLPACLASLMRQRDIDYEILLVDNGSTDRTAELARRDFPQVRLIQAGRNLGFAGGNNLGMQQARGEILVLLNDDTEAPEGWLAALAAPFARDPKIGAAGGKLFYPGPAGLSGSGERIIQHAGGVIYPNGNTGHLGVGEVDRGQWDEPGERAYVTGAVLALRRAALEQVGLLDPDFFPIYFEEVDLQVRLARAGWTIWYEPQAWLIHHESQTQGAGSPRFYYRYTRQRMRYLALQGFPQGKGTALQYELRWLRDVMRAGRLWPVLKAYAAGAAQWPAWRRDRHIRRSVPKLKPRGGR